MKRTIFIIIAVMVAVLICITGCEKKEKVEEKSNDATREEAIAKAPIAAIKGSSKAKFCDGRKSADFMKVVSYYEDDLTEAHSHMLKKYPNLEGKIYVKIVVEESGRVKNVTIDKNRSTINSPEFEKRILEKIRLWKFPEIESGLGEVEYVYPLIFIK